MSITSLLFLLCLAIVLALYYLTGPSLRPWLLLAVSLGFLASFDPRSLVFPLASAAIIWAAARSMNPDRPRQKRAILIAAIVSNLAILAGLKYLAPAIQLTAARFLVPIGLSYYTLQAISYVLDVYWGRIPAESSFFRILLFICYFPQLLQGPISRYQDLSRELTGREHRFSMANLRQGVLLMLWGYFKIFVIGNRIAGSIPGAFRGGLYGLAGLMGLVLFGMELYCNFSGGIDVARGISQCFDIQLPENFRQPYFSRSLGEFWRRWHITLGTWMKDYVFFPFSMSRPVSRLKKNLKKKLPRKLVNRITIAFANVVVFLLVGIWHGSGSNYALWGLYNGLILAFSELMTDHYAAAKKALHIRQDSRLWQGFCMARTFLIVTLGWSTDCAVTAAGSLEILGNLFRLGDTNFYALGISSFVWLLLLGSSAIVIAVSVLREKYGSVRLRLEQLPPALQYLLWAILIQMIACLGKGGVNGGLMYANF